MNRKEIMITAGIAGGIIGIALLTGYLIKKSKQGGMDHTTLDTDRHPAQKKASNVMPGNHQSNYNQVKDSVKPQLPIADEFPLRLGSRGPRVERLQIWLLRNYGYTGKITSVFDEHTQGLLKKYLKVPVLAESTYYRLKMNEPVYRQSINH